MGETIKNPSSLPAGYWPDFEAPGGFGCVLESAGVCCLPPFLFGRRLRAKLMALLGTMSRAPSQEMLAPFFVCVAGCCDWQIALVGRQRTVAKAAMIKMRNDFRVSFNISFHRAFDP